VSEPTSSEAWLTSVGATPEDLEPGDLDWARETYALRGPISRDELEWMAFDAWTATAEAAFPEVVGDIVRTTGLRPHLEIWWPDFAFVEVSGWFSGLLVRFESGSESGRDVPDWGRDLQTALVAVADFVMEPVTEELWSGWPVCPDDGYGLDPEVADGRAIWRCRSPQKEVVAAIGELGAATS
jgi:hypothetical protein